MMSLQTLSRQHSCCGSDWRTKARLRHVSYKIDHPLICVPNSLTHLGRHVDLSYKVQSIVFNTSDSIKATATAVINATKRDPDSGLVTAVKIFDRHRSQTLTQTWPRFFNSREIGQEDVRLTLLAGFRLAPEVMTSIFEAIDWLGLLDMRVNSTIYNAEMFFNLSLTRPEIVIGNASQGAQAGLMLKEGRRPRSLALYRLRSLVSYRFIDVTLRMYYKCTWHVRISLPSIQRQVLCTTFYLQSLETQARG